MFDALRRLFFGRAREAVLPEQPLPPLDLSPLPPIDTPEIIPQAEVVEQLRLGRDDPSVLLRETIPRAVSHMTDLAVVIRYVDTKNDATERLIEIRNVLQAPAGVYLQSYCYKRAAFRSFRLDRVECAYDPQTGELFDLDDYIAKLGPGVPADYVSPAERLRENTRPRKDAPPEPLRARRGPMQSPTERMLDRSADGMRVLLFLGRCDGDYHKSEHAVVVDYVRAACMIDDPNIDPAEFDPVEAETYLRRLRPNVRGFAGAAGRLIGHPNPEHFKLMADEAFRLIEADGAVRPEETKFYNELGRLLRAG